MVDGDFTMLLPHDERVYAYTRRLGGTELLVLGNFSVEHVQVAVEAAAVWADAELVLNNVATPPADGLVLAPWQAVVYRRAVSR